MENNKETTEYIEKTIDIAFDLFKPFNKFQGKTLEQVVHGCGQFTRMKAN